MNRRKKLTLQFKQQKKATNAKMNPKIKAPYIAKAEREQMARLQAAQHNTE